MIEMIGKIKLDDTHYPGEDLYCDGIVEDELLAIVKEHPESEYRKIIEEKGSWPILYHLSPLRENIADWVPMKKTDKVLEVGSGCGAITGAFSRKAGSVTCIDLSKKRSQINAWRHRDCDNVTIRLGNFQDIEPELDRDYDYIFLIGVFEYAQSYIGGEKPFETFMKILLGHLAPGGRLVIAIENRLGLKYWAGCREDHLGDYFSGLEDYPEGGYVRTFSKSALEEICQANGRSDYHFFYPYPDYKFVTTVFSDERLPKIGELSDNMRNFDRDRLLLFDEKNVFDSLVKEKMFPLFSNSYVVVIGDAIAPVYTRFSNDRAEEYAIRTEIEKTKDGFTVRKLPQTNRALPHVKQMEAAYEALKQRFEGGGITLNRCRLEEDAAVFEYLEGKTLEEYLDECLEKEDKEGFLKLFHKYCDIVKYPQISTPCDFDLIFSNIIVEKDNWYLIDYEWTFDKEISAKELITRALYCYSLGSIKRKKISYDLIKDELNYGAKEIEDLIQAEIRFQKYVTGNRRSMTEIRNLIDCRIVPAAALSHRFMEEQHRNWIQIYEDMGEGFKEETSYFMEKGYQEKKPLTVTVPVKPGTKALRIDPSMDFCMIRFHSIKFDERELTLTTNGIILNGNLINTDTVVFATEDPNLTISLEKQADRSSSHSLVLTMEVVRISETMAQGLTKTKQDNKDRIQGIFGKWHRK